MVSVERVGGGVSICMGSLVSVVPFAGAPFAVPLVVSGGFAAAVVVPLAVALGAPFATFTALATFVPLEAGLGTLVTATEAYLAMANSDRLWLEGRPTY
jgi:hypothetical protein